MTGRLGFESQLCHWLKGTQLLALAGSLFTQLANEIVAFTSLGDGRIKCDHLKQGF